MAALISTALVGEALVKALGLPLDCTTLIQIVIAPNDMVKAHVEVILTTDQVREALDALLKPTPRNRLVPE